MSKSTRRPAPRPGPTSKNTSDKNARPRRAAEVAGTKEATRPGSGSGRTAASFRSRHPVLTALVPVAVVVAVLATMVVIKVTGGSSAPASAAPHLAAGSSTSPAHPGTSVLPQSVVAALSVSPATLDAVGTPASVASPSKVGANGAVKRGANGEPLVTYIGAEYCPYCAAERWGLAVALSRFGTFSNLSGTHSSSTDVYPNTQTLSFYGSSYSSPYVDFQAVEETTNQPVGSSYQTLQAPTAAQSALLATYDAQGSIPFVDIGNKYVITGASYSPQLLQGLSRSQIAAQLNDASSPVAQAIDGTANDITAAIVNVTGRQPAGVAGSAVIAAIAKQLGA